MDGMTDPIITADDVVRAGACAEGVARFCQRSYKKLAAAMPVSLALLLTSESAERGYVMKAAYDGDGDGYGYGYGDGDGDCYCYGDSYGYGDGDGSRW